MSIIDYIQNNEMTSTNYQETFYNHFVFNGESGISGSTGVELSEAFYDVDYEHAHYTDNIATRLAYNINWRKEYPQYDDYFPIICLAMDGNTGELIAIGQDIWWGPSWVCGRNASNWDLRGYFQDMEITNTDGYFNSNSYNFSHGKNPNDASLIEQGYDAIARDNQNFYYWFGNNVARIVPGIGGDGSNSGLWNAFNPYNNSVFSQSTPREINVNTNIPVLIYDYDYYTHNYNDINSKVHSYLTDGDLSRFAQEIEDYNAIFCNNYSAPDVPDNTEHYDCYCDIYRGEWDVDDVNNEYFVDYKYLQIWVAPSLLEQNPRVSLYKYGTPAETYDGLTYRALRCKIKVYGDITQIRYSTDGGNTWTVEESPQSLPWDELYYKRTNQRGRYVYDKNHGGNMLLFDSEALCDDGSPWLATDYNDKNFYYPTTNETGTPENSTLMGTTGLASVFSKKYVVNYSDLITIANALFSSGGMVEDLKKGLEMFGNPIEAIQGLMYVPVDCADYFSLVTSSTVILGGYEIPNTNAKLLTRFNGYFDVGSLEIKESFPSGDYRNQEPYCMLNIFLPFVGLETLKLNKYVGKTLSIRYYLDATTGECMACLFADGLLSDYFTGQMGVNLPISLHDYAQFAGASMQALAGIAEGGANALIGTATWDVGRVAQGVTGFEGSMFNLKQNSINNFVTTKGTSSSLLNHFLPNYVYVIFEIIETDETPNLLTVEGRRTNASGNIGAFSGFLQVESVKLNCSGATENEKSKIKDLLSTGIYI